MSEPTIEETAVMIAKQFYDQYPVLSLKARSDLSSAIVSALKARDERAAKIAEAMRPTGGRMWTDEQNACFSALTDCAANIRKG